MSGTTYFPECRLVSAQDDVPRFNWSLPVLYRINERAQKLTWQIAFVDGRLIAAFGHVGGLIQQKGYEIKTNKSGRDIYEQAWVEGLRRYQDQIITKSYRLTLTTESHRYEAMTGHPWDMTRKDLVRYPAAVQPKLDGIRMICYMKDGELHATTRNNRSLSKYVVDWFRREVECWLSMLPTGVALDGEIYNHSLPRHLLASIVSTSKKLHPEIEQLEYHVFDLISRGPTEERYTRLTKSYSEYMRTRRILRELITSVELPDDTNDCSTGSPPSSPISTLTRSESTSTMVTSTSSTMLSVGSDEDDLIYRNKKPIRLVPMFRAYSEQHIKELFDYYVDKGYEGVVVRQMAEAAPNDEKFLERCRYRPGKSNNILKVKKFDDKEFQIVDILEGKGKFKGKAIFVCRTDGGHTFNVVAMGNDQQREQWYQDRASYIGALLKVKYQGMVGDIPQFPVGLEIRNYEY